VLNPVVDDNHLTSNFDKCKPAYLETAEDIISVIQERSVEFQTLSVEQIFERYLLANNYNPFVLYYSTIEDWVKKKFDSAFVAMALVKGIDDIDYGELKTDVSNPRDVAYRLICAITHDIKLKVSSDRGLKRQAKKKSERYITDLIRLIHSAVPL
jgi:hypothetical protein